MICWRSLPIFLAYFFCLRPFDPAGSGMMWPSQRRLMVLRYAQEGGIAGGERGTRARIHFTVDRSTPHHTTPRIWARLVAGPATFLCIFGFQVFERGRRSPRGHGGPGDTLTLGVERILGCTFVFLRFVFHHPLFCCALIMSFSPVGFAAKRVFFFLFLR